MFPMQELEEALDEWGDGLKELDNMKAELSQYIIAEDGVVLKKQVEALHRQWEELCLRVRAKLCVFFRPDCCAAHETIAADL